MQKGKKTLLDKKRNEEFVRLFVKNQRRISAFITTLLPNSADAEDVLQETSVISWQKFHEFQPGTNFASWACSIARFEVLKFRRQQRPAQLIFSDTLLEELANRQLEEIDEFDVRYTALAICMEKQRPVDRELFCRYYQSDNTAKQVAEQLDRPVNTVYKALNRIRRALHECISRYIAREKHI